MKIGVLSDSHDRLPALERVLQLFAWERVEAVLHAGDFVAPFAAKLLADDRMNGVPVHCVYGNNDGERDGLKQVLPRVQDGPLRLKLGGRTIVMHHALDWLKPKDKRGADVIITGHTHEVSVDRKTSKAGDRLLLNPGECCGWVTGRCTAAVLDLDTLEPRIVDIDV